MPLPETRSVFAAHTPVPERILPHNELLFAAGRALIAGDCRPWQRFVGEVLMRTLSERSY